MSAWHLGASLALLMGSCPGCSAWYLGVTDTCTTGHHQCLQHFCCRCHSTWLLGMSMSLQVAKWVPLLSAYICWLTMWQAALTWMFRVASPILARCCCGYCNSVHSDMCHHAATPVPFETWLDVPRPVCCHMIKRELSCLQMDPKFLRNQVCL